MELSDRDRLRIAGLTFERHMKSLNAGDLVRHKVIDKLSSCLNNLPHDFKVNLASNVTHFVDEFMARSFGYGKSEQNEEWFGQNAYIAIIALRFADKDGVSLNIHTRRRIYDEGIKGYTPEQVYEFFKICTLQLLEFMAPQK